MSLAEFTRNVYAVAMASPICGIPTVRRPTPTAINLRLAVTMGGFIDAFYNTQTGTTAFTSIHEERRVFGADSAGGWHLHPFADPDRREPLSSEVCFSEFVAEIARHQSVQNQS